MGDDAQQERQALSFVVVHTKSVSFYHIYQHIYVYFLSFPINLLFSYHFLKNMNRL